MKKVQVLLSSYNGEKYLAEQIESILAQDYQWVSLLIRDDGSTDHTVDIIKNYAEKYENIDYYTGDNLGVQKSFFHLMQHANKTAEYYAFSDQDDVWLPEKIRRAVEMLEKQDGNRPLLYASETTLVDEHLNEISMKIKTHKIEPDFGNALVENACTGCTEVFNRELLKLVNSRTPAYTVMHDWWLYLCASAFGKVICDSKSEILYRQHKNNEIGKSGNWQGEMHNRIKNFKKANGALRKQATEFRRLYGTDYENSQYTDWVADYKRNISYRWKLVFSSKVYRQRKIDDLIFRGLFLIGMR